MQPLENVRNVVQLFMIQLLILVKIYPEYELQTSFDHARAC